MNRTVLVAFILVVALLVWQYVRRTRALRAAARRILNSLRQSFAVSHELKVVAELPADVREALSPAARSLEAAGLQHVFDFEDVTVSESAGQSIPLQAFVSPTEPIGAFVFHHPQLGRTLVDVATNLSDGRRLTSTTAAEALKLQNPPELPRRTEPSDISAEEVVARHRQWLKEELAANTGLTASVPRTPDEILEEARRGQRLKYDHRRGLGWITLDELTTLSGGRREIAAVTYAQIQRELAREARKG